MAYSLLFKQWLEEWERYNLYLNESFACINKRFYNCPF